MSGTFLYGPYMVSAEGGALAPGAEAVGHWGPWEWEQRAITVTATPVSSTGIDTVLTVVRTSLEVKPDGSRFLYARVKNIGPDPVNFGWYVGGVWKALGE